MGTAKVFFRPVPVPSNGVQVPPLKVVPVPGQGAQIFA